MQSKSISRSLAAIAAAVAVMTAPVVTSTAVALVVMATPAQAGLVLSERPVSSWEQFKIWLSGLVLSERKQP